MLTSRQQGGYPCGQTRREFVWEMGGGFTGVALTSLLAGSGFFAKHATGSALSDPLASKAGHFPAKAKACIFLMMNGGPSQVDTFDYKPELRKHAGKALPPDKNYINSGGVGSGSLLPTGGSFTREGRVDC